MARRNPNVSVSVDLEADASSARRELANDLKGIERDAESTVDGIKRAFEGLSPELDTTEIRKAIELAGQLDGMVASFTVDTDLDEIREAEQLAKSLRSFQGRVDLSVEGRDELKEALGLAEKMDQLRQVKIEVQGREDLERAGRIADDLERRRTVPIDAQASDLVRLDDEIEAAVTKGGEAGADGVAEALSDIDFQDIGSSAAEKMSGAMANAGPWLAAAASIGALVGDEVIEGVNNALPTRKEDTIRALRFNFSDADLAEIGQAGGAAYSDGLAEGLSEAKDVASLLKAELGGIDDELDLTEATRQALTLARVFDIDVRDAITAVDSLVERGLVKNTSDGFNLLFDLGQRLGLQFEEMFELIDEMGSAVDALGIQGTHGLEMMADMVERRVTPQVDQAGELFEELNETVLTGGAAEGLELIGLNAEEMQRRIAASTPDSAAAVAEIARAILAIDDPAQRAARSTEIFGSNMGLLGDEARTAALEVFATADATEEMGDKAGPAADQLEDAATGIDRLKKVAVDFGEQIGDVIAPGLDTLDHLAEMDFGEADQSLQQFTQNLGDFMLGPLAGLAEKAGIDYWGPWENALERLRGKLDEAGEAGGSAGRRFDEAGEKGGHAGRRFDEELAPGAESAADALDRAKEATERLDAALDVFSGRFDEDQIMRRIEEDTIAATEAVKGLEDGAYKLGTGFDISTEKGRNAQAALEDLSGSLDTAIDSYQRGHISGQTLADTHARIEAAVREVAGEMNATEAETEELIGTYARVPPEVRTRFYAETQAALGAVAAYAGAILAVPTSRTTTLTTYQQTVVRPTASVDQFGKASGGPVEAGRIYRVGEMGEEWFMPDEDGTIVPHDETQRILDGNPRARALAAVGASAGAGGGGGTQRLELVIGSDGSPLGDLLVRVMRKEVRNRGGIDVVFN